MKHKTDQRNHAGTWTKKPCSCIRRDIIDRHSKSAMHREAVEKEVLLKQSARDGGIARAFEKQVTAQRNAVVGAMKVVYWLAKEEVAHTTKYESLLDLAQRRLELIDLSQKVTNWPFFQTSLVDG